MQPKWEIIAECVFYLTAIAGIIIMLIALSGCTLSMTLVDTHGTADDLVDEGQSVTPNVSATVPVKAI